MLKKILLGAGALIAVAIVVVLGLATMKPDTFHVERSTVIDAAPENIFPLIANLHTWPQWSPYEKLDPDMAREYGGPESGPGASYAWKGNGNVGEGRMEIIRADAPNEVAIQLDFVAPFEAHNIATFTLVPEGEATKVTWAMDGPVDFTTKIVHVLLDMDAMIGAQFDEGLTNLKAEVEK
jgi:hypothetical protein